MVTEGADCEVEGGAGLASESEERRRELAFFHPRTLALPTFPFPKSRPFFRLGKFVTSLRQGLGIAIAWVVTCVRGTPLAANSENALQPAHCTQCQNAVISAAAA